MPLAEDVAMVRDYVLHTLKDLNAFQLFNEASFVRLRNAACCRLSLSNGRRGKLLSWKYRLFWTLSHKHQG